MSGQPQTTTKNEQQTRAPYGPAQQYFPPLYQQGSGAVQQNQNLPIPQNYVAGANPTELSAVQQTLNTAPQLGASGGALSDIANKIAGGFFLNPSNDPTFAGTANAAITPVTRQLTQQVLPSNIGNAIKLGGTGGAGPSAYGGGSLALDTEKILQDYSANALNTTASMANASRLAGMNLIPQAGNIANAANTQLLAPATATGAAGTALQGYAQQDINNLLQRYQTQLQAPWNGLQNFANLLSTGGFGDTTGTSQTIGSTPSIATQILQGLTGGAGVVGSLFGSGPGGSPSAASNFGDTLGGLLKSLPTALPFLAG